MIQPDSPFTNVSVAKGHFGAAYVHAVAAGAGFGVQVAGAAHDAAGVDLTVIALPAKERRRSSELHVQVKCTSRAQEEDDHIVLDLPRKNYDELSATVFQIPLILVAVVVPDDPSQWLTQTAEALIARRCAYWRSLVGEPATTNENSVRVRLPRAQMLTPEALQAIMGRVCNGGLP